MDSSVAAAALLSQGYEVTGVYLECYNEPGCRTDQDKADALKVALKLGIKFVVLDFRKEYKEKVIEYFYREYGASRTPNPDVVCNREIKFGLFYEWALRQAQGKPRYDFVATGHYARISLSGVSRKVRRARDVSKDQSYFLWQIPRDHLAKILFPLGEKLKSEVRTMARKLDLPTAKKPDSMGICFMGEVNVQELLKERLGEQYGEVLWGGKIVGKHRGLWFYTIGQRGGWEMLSEIQSDKMPPLYVTGKDREHNRLIVGKREETMKREFMVAELDEQDFKEAGKLWVRVRNLGKLYEVAGIADGVVKTREAIFGIAEGQSAVFYGRNGVLVGAGIIV